MLASERVDWGSRGARSLSPLAPEGRGLWGPTVPLESGLSRGPAVAGIRAGQAPGALWVTARRVCPSLGGRVTRLPERGQERPTGHM